MNERTARLRQLRKAMAKAGVEYYYLSNGDPHGDEYLPMHWQVVKWLTGFSGDVAQIVISQEEALLWTDSRFFISGAQELADSPYTLKKLKVPGEGTPLTWLDEQNLLKMGDLNIGVDGSLLTKDFADALAAIGYKAVDLRPWDKIWTDRPPLPLNPVEIYSDRYSGETTKGRLHRIVEAIRAKQANALILTRLDDIAWALNLRGSDIHCTPVFVSYAIISEFGSTLFVNRKKMSKEVMKCLQMDGIKVKSYDSFITALQTLGRRYTLLADPSEITLELDNALQTASPKVILSANPVTLMKALKNEVESEGERIAMLKDGIALTRFYHWLDDRLNRPSEFMMGNDGNIVIANEVTELDCVAKLREFRQEQEDYRDESFDAIVGWREHAALPHYFPTEESNVPISGNGLLLIDTGGQYLDGTTDITRTIPVGTLTEEEKRDYTLVLKGHIRLATACFPEGTRGDQLDALARMDLWKEGKTYLHGTGHGVGHYLCCHEGPESVRMEHNPQPLMEGMIISNEPAMYVEGSYGVRHENCIRVVRLCTGFLQFETLTLCWIDTSPIKRELIGEDERRWIDEYNNKVYNELAPHLNESDRMWLAAKTRPMAN